MAKAIKKVKEASAKLAKIRKKPGMSNAGKYPNVKESNFCGPNGTYPVNTIKRAKSALKLAHFSANPGDIRECVHKKYPQLAADEKREAKKKSPVTYGNNPIKFIPDPRKKGKKYKTGSYIDESDHETNKYTTSNNKLPGNRYNVENLSRIEEDDKSQYMVSLDDSYGSDKKSKIVSNYDQGRNAVRDTLRPKKGKHFIMKWD
tara:strand:+ start:534 stop:1142 length:609 start_codon:yes stop_codon:yes gene_type:complete